MSGHIAELSRRGVVAVAGPDAEKFLNDVITTDVPELENGASYGGLLTPQGKVLFDFIVLRTGDRYLFDLPRNLVADFIKRLSFYRLRAKVEITDLSDDHIVVAAWGTASPPILDGPVAVDPRHPDLGFRAIVPAGADMAPDFDEAREEDYDAHRIGLGIPEGGIDFRFGDAFPHDAAMDQLAGIDFKKGCYVGQEVVSRMEHRGTARRRFVRTAGVSLPTAGSEVVAADRALGTTGSTANGVGLALVRLDRAREAMDAGTAITAAGAVVTLTLPAWAKYTWPSASQADGD